MRKYRVFFDSVDYAKKLCIILYDIYKVYKNFRASPWTDTA